ncbi:efflux RND transporter periplasmic adaptor subunit [bacterium]|nr:efflux RND transporter periplasmic adaptor subunit [bacterium]MDA7528074.1 efflux RND transporter periplasmic adaptor subunit [bacterium]MDB4439670.1 efflux RND transporter periplasmic adaptor subunit [Planctomicrobium sp.]MDB4802697.1 efflux RND transporter periplasmic adaptor subunit [bacterium]
MVFLRWFGRLILCCCAVFAAWGAWYVVYQESLTAIEEKEEPRKKNPLAVEIAKARLDQVQERIVLVGNFIPVAQTEVRSLVDGYIVSLPFEIGDHVEVGQTLCQLDDANHRDLLDQARAKLVVAEAQLAVQNSELKSFRRTLDREVMLDDIGAGTKEALETAMADHEVALARQKLEESRVAEVKATLTGLELQLKDFELSAPISGYVSARHADIGDLAKSDLPIMQIVNLNQVLTTVQIIEKDYQKVAVGQSATVKVDAYPAQTFQGKVTRIAPTLDQETRTASVQIEVANKQQKLKPGMYARVSLNSEISKKAVMIPLAAVLEVNGKASVFLVNSKDQIERRALLLGTSDGNVVEVSQGIQPGDKVVTLGNRLIQPGQTVTSQEVPWSTIELIAADQTEKIKPEESAPLAGE